MSAARRAPILRWLGGSATWLALLIASMAFGVVLAVSGIAQPISDTLYDSLSRRLAPPPSGDILIVAIDDASIDSIGRWPWPRGVHAGMIDRIAAGHPRAIVYDVLFTEPAAPADDAAMARAIHGAGRVVLPALMEVPGPNGADLAIKRPIGMLLGAGALVGHSNVAVDRDGVLRHAALADATLGHVAAVAVDGPGAARRTDRPLVAFSAPGAFRTISFAALAQGEIPPAYLHDKIVIVGATAAGLGDRYATPSADGAGLTPGVETIASIASNLLEQRLIADPGWRGSLLFVFPALLCLALSFRLLTPLRSAAVMLLMIGLCLAASTMLLRAQLWLDPIPAILALSVFFPVWGWYRLAVVSGFIDAQLVRLSADHGPLDTRRRRAAAPDRLEWRSALLDRTIARMQDLRLFVDSSFRNLPDATLVLDRRGRIVIASTEAQDIFRAYCGVGLPRHAGLAWRYLRPLVASGHAALERIAADDAAPAAAPNELVLLDERYFQIESSRFVAAESAAVFTILRLSDITARKRAERDRQRALEFLSHDIRAPQTTLIGMVAQLDRHVDPEMRAGITRVAQRTLSLAQSFVDIARAQSDRLVLAPTDMAETLRDSVDLLWNDFKAKGVRVRLELPEDEALVLADGLLLARAFQNVLTNAVRHAPAGSEIHARIVARGNRWRCTIDDAGPGIGRSAIGRLFMRFETGGRQSGGTGLGLSLVKAVCEAFGGSVRCYSRPGTGTRFTILLPRFDPA